MDFIFISTEGQLVFLGFLPCISTEIQCNGVDGRTLDHTAGLATQNLTDDTIPHYKCNVFPFWIKANCTSFNTFSWLKPLNETIRHKGFEEGWQIHLVTINWETTTARCSGTTKATWAGDTRGRSGREKTERNRWMDKEEDEKIKLLHEAAGSTEAVQDIL